MSRTSRIQTRPETSLPVEIRNSSSPNGITPRQPVHGAPRPDHSHLGAPLHEVIKAALIIAGCSQQTVVGNSESSIQQEVPGGADIEFRFAGPHIPTDLADNAAIDIEPIVCI